MGDGYRQLVNTKLDGMVNGGRCTTVEVGGLLGGGLGPFTRTLGSGYDSLKELTLVSAEGKIVPVSDEDYHSATEGKLFWAIRGAGGNNFGVVVQFKMYLQELIDPNKEVVAGLYTWYPESDANPDDTSMAEFMSAMRDLYTIPWPD